MFTFYNFDYLQFFAPIGDAPIPAALAALSCWTLPAAELANSTTTIPQQTWVTSGPVTNVSGPYYLSIPLLAYVTTSSFSSGMVELVECILPPLSAQGQPVMALTRFDEGCGSSSSGPFAAGSILRVPGWIGPSSASAITLGWTAVVQPELNLTMGSTPSSLWRCKASFDVGIVYSASFGDPSCSTAGSSYVPDVLLGYALGPIHH